MALQFRRVVTGHDEAGRAVVKIDEIAQNLVSSRRAPPPASFGRLKASRSTTPGTRIKEGAQPARRSTTAPSFASSSLLPGRARAIIAPTRSIMR